MNSSYGQEVFQYSIFKTMDAFVMVKLRAALKNPDRLMMIENAIEFLINVFDRLHAQLPSLGLKEICLAFVVTRNRLFCPQIVEQGNMTEEQWLEIQGFRLKGARRESTRETFDRLKLLSVIYVGMHISDAYIGRLFLQVKAYL